MSRFTTEHFTCNHCELATGPVEHDFGEDEEDGDAPRVPLGWVEIVVRRVVPNPALAAELASRDAFVRRQVEALAAQASKQGEKPTAEDIANMMALTRDQIDAENPIDEAPYVVEEDVGHLCVEHAHLVDELLALEDEAPPAAQ